MNRVVWLRGLLAVLGLVCVASGVRAQRGRDIGPMPAGTRPEGRRVALVIGVNRYNQSEALPPLMFAEKDARDLTERLTAAGFLVRRMTADAEGMQPLTAVMIRDEIVKLATSTGREDTILVYFSGHGFASGEAGDTRNWICPIATDPGNLPATAISLEEISAILSSRDCAAPRKLLWVDACRNQPGVRGSLLRGFERLELAASPGIGHLYSTAPGSRSFEPSAGLLDDRHREIRNGIFTHYLLAGLAGEAEANGDRCVTFRELGLYVGEKMRAFALDHPNFQQRPFERWDGPSDSDVLLVTLGPPPAGRADPPGTGGAAPAPDGSPASARSASPMAIEDYLAKACVILDRLKGSRLYSAWIGRVRDLDQGNMAVARALPGRREGDCHWNRAWIEHNARLRNPREQAKLEAAEALHALFDSWWASGGRELVMAAEQRRPVVSGSGMTLDAFLAEANVYVARLKGSRVYSLWRTRLRELANDDPRTFRGLPGNRQPGAIWGAALLEHGARLDKVQKHREAADALHRLFDTWWASGGQSQVAR